MRVPPPDESLAKKRARGLRQSATPPEIRLCSILRQRPLDLPKFRRQMPFGPYILDFAAPAERLAIEIDGETHYVGDGPRRDACRDAFLAGHDWSVQRFLNADVLNNLDGVVAVIAAVALAPTIPTKEEARAQ